MFLKLRTKLILFIIAGSFINIIVVSTLINMILFREYDDYMIKEQENRIQHLIIMIEQSYRVNDGWTTNTIEHIDFSPYIHDFDMTIKDTRDNIIFKKYMDPHILRDHHEMMRRMGRNRLINIWGMNRLNRAHRMRMEGPEADNYSLKEYILQVDGENIGSLKLGHVGVFTIHERDISFTRGMNRSIIYSALISILTALFIGMYISKKFTRPIVEMTKAANNIRLGNLDTRVEEQSDTLELQQLSSSINHLSESLWEQNKLRKRLTSDISHELRTPLTILQSHIEAIIDGVWEPSEDKLNICKNEVIRLIKLVEELRHLNYIESHRLKLDLEKYNLSKDLFDVIEGFQGQFIEKKIQVTKSIERDIYIEADKDKIKQILINLISNALKYTNVKGAICILLEEADNKITLKVKDNGIGIHKEDLPYVFERMYRSDRSRNRSTGGSGIGLAIVKTLVEAHGGDVIINSQKDIGTEVIVKLPGIKNK